MEQFKADDGEYIHLKISGNGTPMVMLHGWTADHRVWSPFIPDLGTHHQTFRWDARAHGGHLLATNTVPTVSRMAQDLQNLLDHYRLNDVTLVAHSMGALTTWQYIRDFGTKRLARVCFIDQSPKLVTDDDWKLGIYGDFDAERAQAFHEDLKENFAEGVLDLIAFGLNQRAHDDYLSDTVGTQKRRAWLQTLKANPLIACWDSLTAADFRDVLEKIDIPSLLIYGGESHFYLPETAHYVSQRIQDAQLHVYEGADHSPQHSDIPRFIADLLAFTQKSTSL